MDLPPIESEFSVVECEMDVKRTAFCSDTESTTSLIISGFLDTDGQYHKNLKFRATHI